MTKNRKGLKFVEQKGIRIILNEIFRRGDGYMPPRGPPPMVNRNNHRFLRR